MRLSGGALLVDSGNIDPRYIESMFAREQVANTYLCSGMRFPMGMPENRTHFKHRHFGVANPLKVSSGMTKTPFIFWSVSRPKSTNI